MIVIAETQMQKVSVESLCPIDIQINQENVIFVLLPKLLHNTDDWLSKTLAVSPVATSRLQKLMKVKIAVQQTFEVG